MALYRAQSLRNALCRDDGSVLGLSWVGWERVVLLVLYMGPIDDGDDDVLWWLLKLWGDCHNTAAVLGDKIRLIWPVNIFARGWWWGIGRWVDFGKMARVWDWWGCCCCGGGYKIISAKCELHIFPLALFILIPFWFLTFTGWRNWWFITRYNISLKLCIIMESVMASCRLGWYHTTTKMRSNWSIPTPLWLTTRAV